jgi:hypothetical protein
MKYYIDYDRRNVFYVEVLKGKARIRERARERAKWSPWNYIRYGWKECTITPLGHVQLAIIEESTTTSECDSDCDLVTKIKRVYEYDENVSKWKLVDEIRTTYEECPF